MKETNKLGPMNKCFSNQIQRQVSVEDVMFTPLPGSSNRAQRPASAAEILPIPGPSNNKK